MPQPPNQADQAFALWPGTPLLLGFVAGSAWQLQQLALWSWPSYAVLLAASLLVSLLLQSRFMAPAGMHGSSHWPQAQWLGRVTAYAVLACALAFALCGLRATAFINQALAPPLEGRDLVLTGVVAAMPQRGDGGVRFRFALESATQEGRPVALPPRLQLGWYHGLGVPAHDTSAALALPSLAPADLRAGERWRLAARLKAPHGNLNPHGFDYELWLWEQGVQATGYVRAGPKDPPPQRLGATWLHPVERARQAVRDAIFARLGRGAGADGEPAAGLSRQRAAGIVAALVTGDQAAIERADWDIFRATGVAHLMSISGLHITLFAWGAAAVLGWLWRRGALLGLRGCLWLPAPSAGLLGGLLLATAYAVFSGWGVPAQRTIWMLACAIFLRLSGRRWPWPTQWLLACAVVVALDPWALMQAGFWLSFVAVGVLFATTTPAQPQERPASPGGAAEATATDQATTPRHARLAHANALVGQRLGALLREQAVVTLALTPLTLLLFGQASLVGLLANLLAIPWVTLVVTPLALAGVALPFLWDAAAWALQPLAAFLGALAALPFAAVSVPTPALWAGAAGVLGGCLLVARAPWGLRVLGLPLLLPVLLWQAPRPATGQFELLAADVGQGSAIVIRTARHTLLYDAGPRYGPESDAGHRVLVPLLRALGERVDTLLISHRDSDHSGGARAVLAMQPQAQLLSSLEDGHELHAARRLAQSTRCQAGQHWAWDGVQFAVLHPSSADYARRQKPNALSCVLRVSNGLHSALLVGDIEAAQEAHLVATQAARPEPGAGPLEGKGATSPLRAHLLLVPHHGSKTSSSPAFLDAVAPQLALVQAGYRNRFGHPAEPVLARYAQRGIRVVDSAHCGAAWWTSAAPQGLVCQREAARRYWHHQPPIQKP